MKTITLRRLQRLSASVLNDEIGAGKVTVTLYSKPIFTIQRREAQLRARRKQHDDGIRTEVLKHYGNGKLACIQCGESRLPCLTIDHIEGNGAKHRREIKRHGGAAFCTWLKQQGYPEGYRTLCMNCQLLVRPEKPIIENEQILPHSGSHLIQPTTKEEVSDAQNTGDMPIVQGRYID